MSSVRDKLWRRLAAGAGVIPACDRELMYEAKEELEKQAAEIERLRAYTDACNTLLAERVEIECLRGLAIRAWHSFRSGLSATGGCRDGLTDGDILELVRLSNTESAKLRGHDSVASTIAATIAENEREDEPIE